ncbi:MAG: hypothetical protein GXO93_07540 [FCB group bacterium]|nr:hypothetical protein [FCB group bacterium]
MLYLLAILLIVLALLLISKIRIKAIIKPDGKTLFVGLGHIGTEYDFISKKSVFKIFKLKIKLRKKIEKIKKTPKTKPKAKKKKITWNFIKQMAKHSQAIWQYLSSLVKSVTIEKLEGKIVGGFERPDLTGIMFGYYQATMAIAPQISKRFQFVPDWQGNSWQATLQASLAIPFYKFMFHTLSLILKLPLRELLKVAIGKKKGAQDD